MKIVNYWEQFLCTGKIDDYLAYREEKAGMQKAAEPEKDEGAERDEGRSQGYRDDFKDRRYWGI